jgi:rubrerythrin
MVELCAICTWEHLGDAAVELLHAKSADDPERIKDHAAEASMYLRQAEFQADDPGLAKAIRDLRYKVEGPVFGQKYADIVELVLDVDDVRKLAQKRLPQSEEGTGHAHKIAHGRGHILGEEKPEPHKHQHIDVHGKNHIAAAIHEELSEESGAAQKYHKLAEDLRAESLKKAAEKVEGIAADETKHRNILAKVDEAHATRHDVDNPGGGEPSARQTFLSWDQIPREYFEDELKAREYAMKVHRKRGGSKKPWVWVDEDGIGLADEDAEGYGEESSVGAGGLEETSGNPGNPGHVKGTYPFASTKCEKAHPAIQKKIESCVLQVKRGGQKVNPWAVCRAAIDCPGEKHESPLVPALATLAPILKEYAQQVAMSPALEVGKLGLKAYIFAHTTNPQLIQMAMML